MQAFSAMEWERRNHMKGWSKIPAMDWEIKRRPGILVIENGLERGK